jgi:hypothetical protein
MFQHLQILNSELDKRLLEEEKEGLDQLVNQAEQIKQKRVEEEEERRLKREKEMEETVKSDEGAE